MSNFQATLRRYGLNKFEVWIKLSGTSPFVKGANTYIATAGVPIMFSGIEDTTRIEVMMEDEVFGDKNVYDVTINPLAQTAGVANSPQKYFSINFETHEDADQVIAKGKEYKFFTFAFDEEAPDEIGLMNVSYRMVRGNEQAQFTIEDNHANEYTAPFHNEGDPCPFYSTKDHSKIAYGGKGSGGEAGMIPNTYVRYVKTV